MINTRILWLATGQGYSSAMKLVLEGYMRKVGLSPANAFYMSVHKKVSSILMFKRGKWIPNPTKQIEIGQAIREYIALVKPKLIVVNDAAALMAITDGNSSLFLCRGSVYFFDGIPCICIDDLNMLRAQKTGSWILLSDLEKIDRWLHDKQRKEPKFNYKVTRSLEEAKAALEFIKQSVFLSCDIETKGTLISCVGYSALNADGRIQSFVFPFFNPSKHEGSHWISEIEEYEVWQIIKTINASDIPKVFQNGSYDNAYFLKYHVPVTNWFYDTMHMFHSVYCEAPKKLNFIASMLLDYCRYWKDESKGEEEERVTPEGLERYWRYNALDCHNTLLICRVLIAYINQLPWARSNYDKEFRLQIGPAIAGTMRGLKVDANRHTVRLLTFEKESTEELAKLRVMVDMPDFNPRSTDQVAQLLYDVLGAQPIKKVRGKPERSTDEKLLKIIASQHPIYDKFIEAIWDAKKPASALSNFSHKILFKGNGRFAYSLNAAGTETSRFAGKEHPFWCGRNPQNVQMWLRDMMVADDGYVFFEPDYSQSDARFVAYESEDTKYIANVDSDKDTHCLHAAHFFKQNYEFILAEYKADNPIYADNVKGIRAITKRLVHGSNFRMRGRTLYLTMGRKQCIAAAIAIGHKDAAKWSERQLIELCDVFLADYHNLYPGLKPWFAKIVEEAVNNGNLATCAFGFTRLFFGDLANDENLQRELTAFYGQGGTAGNINRVLLDIFYRSRLELQGVMFLTQTHDSILFLIPKDKLYLCDNILTIMEEATTIKGRQLAVPAEGKLGFSWGDGLVKYKKGMDPNKAMEAALAAEAKVKAKYQKMAKEVNYAFSDKHAVG